MSKVHDGAAKRQVGTLKATKVKAAPAGHSGDDARPTPPASSGLARPSTPLFLVLLLLFLGSGCAALIYEIVWFQLLELTVGSSAMSIAVLLATFMGGMCVGSLGLARVVPLDRHPLLVYAILEFGIAVCGLLVLWLLPYAGGLYLAVGGHGFGGLLLRGVLSMLCLLPPTILMGASLPAVSRWVETSPEGVSWLGYLYGGNTLGAVAGCVLAGFYLLRVHDMYVATYVAIALNVVVGAVALWMSRAAAYAPVAAGARAADTAKRSPMWPVLVTIGLSGLTALSAEVVWTRLLSLQLGPSVYTYSLILAAVLLGIGLGSYISSLILDRTRTDPRSALGWCQVMLAAAIAWSAYLVMVVLPASVQDAAVSASPMVAFQHDFLVCLVTVLPAGLLCGASFPFALAAARRDNEDPGRVTGFVYAANTAGAIVGSLGTPLVAMAALGSQHVLEALILVAALSGGLMLLPIGVDSSRRARTTPQTVGIAGVAVLVAAALALTVQPVPAALIGYGPGSSYWQSSFGEFLYVGEGMNGSIAVSRFPNGVLSYHNAGKVQASSEPQDLRAERMVGHLTTLIPEHPKKVLVIACGAGVMAGAVSIDPRVEHVTIVEIEPLVPKAAQKYLSSINEGIVANPKTTVVIDDARHYLMTSHEKFDAITSDPFEPWTKGTAPLFTREFFQSVKDHLEPGGVATFWVPLFRESPETAKSQIGTFTDVFPNGVVWGNNANGRGYDVCLSGQPFDTPIDLDAVDARVARPEYAKVRASLAGVGFDSTDDLFATYATQGSDLQRWLADAELNLDRNLRLQYIAGMSIGDVRQGEIYDDMVKDRTWPQWLFTGSPKRVDSLRNAVANQ